MNTYYDIHCHIFNKDVIIRKLVNVVQSFVALKELLNTEKSKILYGSDFFLAQFFGPTMEQYFDDFQKTFNSDFDIIAAKNPELFLNQLA
jgi:hypothetical protein